uniref:Transmembrane protein 235 n=1 Tax=Myripristis murdjan TaxID=586833 RepID=A0A668AGA9_9TELE
MRITFGSLVITAGICGILSFALLAAAIGSQYWYIIEINPLNTSDVEDMNSHSGLWRTSEGMHSVIVVVLPLSLVLMAFGGICGLVSSLARSPALLTCLLTLSGVSLYIIYSHQVLAETERLVGKEGLALVTTSFGWSLGMAWLSYGLELLTALLLLVAAHIARVQ